MSMVKLILFPGFYRCLLFSSPPKQNKKWLRQVPSVALPHIDYDLLAMDDKTVENTHQLYV